MVRAALTGGIATGKSYCLSRFAALGAATIDADRLARDAVAPGTPGLQRVVERFGAGILLPDGTLDRPALGRIVFGDRGARADLEAIIHPEVYRRIGEWLADLPAGTRVAHKTGSITGIEGSGKLLDYSSTKGAIHAFTKSLAQALVDQGIRVNCVAPGPVWTPLNVADKDAKDAARHGEDVPMGRPAQPEEIAPAFVFFASNPDSSYITGEVLTLLGGETVGA